MVDLSGFDHKSIVERAKAIILTPKDEWTKIAAETTGQAHGRLAAPERAGSGARRRAPGQPSPGAVPMSDFLPARAPPTAHPAVIFP